MATTLEKRDPTPRSAEEERLIALRKRDTRRKWFWRITGYVVILGVWQLFSSTVFDPRIVPGPVQIVQVFPEIIESGRFLQSYAATLTRIGVGFGISFAFGIALGIATQIPWINGFFKDAVTISLVSPGLVWALTGLVIWIVLWAIGVKSFDAFFVPLVLGLLAVGIHLLTRYLPGRASPDA